MSSFVKRNTFTISRFAAKDFPEPGVPRNSPFGFLSRGTFLTGKTEKDFLAISALSAYTNIK
jgi:hypothetical protein